MTTHNAQQDSIFTHVLIVILGTITIAWLLSLTTKGHTHQTKRNKDDARWQRCKSEYRNMISYKTKVIGRIDNKEGGKKKNKKGTIGKLETDMLFAITVPTLVHLVVAPCFFFFFFFFCAFYYHYRLRNML
ncbi:hypothetical protein BCR41DRAFT_83552 [Lobosporangium transversale]|uniref:Transmembrane protein n=1 Tax=Lobosporangium transversale TaxID=64571 RepID=A0A1Y2GL10_9FUNG|nr:hypothetical protein BCR41DRAFT_83552 [Lobosporangium transversale]ORZ14292.1 hypothetical protein BCR41DRAFT_83552 [Lobosporangium transversale]|eukprot:XP_021880770.1 hypothetical protein BCR41DRAFT_83552 [Lobosporangium transversale]